MPRHDLEVVTVFETTDSFALGLAKAALEDAGIHYLLKGEPPAYGPAVFTREFGAGMPPFQRGEYTIQVSREDEHEARELLEPLAHPEP